MLGLSFFSPAHARAVSPLDSSPRAQARSSASPAASQSATSTAGSGGSTGASGSGTNTSSNSATITANDFLTLLVTEIQNQDPTSQTDPMTYITQLVGVNSLEELMQINQTLTNATTPVTTTSSSGTGGTAPAGSAAASAAVQEAQLAPAAASGTGGHQLSVAASGQATGTSTDAVAQALTHSAVMPPQVAPPTQVPLNPEVLRALQHSIPGAKLIAPSSGSQ